VNQNRRRVKASHWETKFRAQDIGECAYHSSGWVSCVVGYFRKASGTQ